MIEAEILGGRRTHRLFRLDGDEIRIIRQLGLSFSWHYMEASLAH